MQDAGERISMRELAATRDYPRHPAAGHRLRARSQGVRRNMITPIPARPVDVPRKLRERRACPRSPKNIRVLVLPEDCAVDEPYGGWIIDASRGGVRIRLPHELVPV